MPRSGNIMHLTFLGTSAGAPTRTRNVTSLALTWTKSGRLWLFDCGEGTQHRIQQTSLKLSHLDIIFVSHMHGDHIFGLPGLMASRSASQSVQSELTIFGPEALEDYLKSTFAVSSTRIKYPWNFRPIFEGTIFEDDHCVVECRLLNHGIPSYGFAIVEKPQPGHFNAAMAAELGVPSGPLYAELKRGVDVTLDDGTLVPSAGLVGASTPGRKVVVCADTGVSAAAVELSSGATLVVHEATFMSDQTARAIEVGHSTAAQAAEMARAAGAGMLILTHISPRYEQQGSSALPHVLSEAQAIFEITVLAEDLMTVEINHSEDHSSNLKPYPFVYRIRKNAAERTERLGALDDQQSS